MELCLDRGHNETIGIYDARSKLSELIERVQSIRDVDIRKLIEEGRR